MRFIKKKNKSINGYKVVSFVFLVIIFYFGFIVLAGDYYNGVPYAKYLKALAWSKDGLNTGVITALVAIVGIIITITTHHSGINANIVSKERTRWMANHKQIVAEYITDITNYSLLVEHSIMYNEKSKKEGISDERKREFINKKENIIDQVNDLILAIEKNKNLLRLELHSHGTENPILLKAIEQPYNTSVKARLLLKNGKKEEAEKELKILKKDLQILTEQSSEFYYNVWQQIKNND